ncbi:MAG: DUF2461 domain-containing protein [Planctomycetales bacterium]|nr:DUF2461 domain-containing protein [Planctomycetales bacterium]
MAAKNSFPGFDIDVLHFLHDLSQNNNRDWFEKNKQRYETAVREPALHFIESMVGPLKKVSPHFRAVAKKTGGSLMRVYRDTRFSNDKTPYKTNVGIHFRHEVGKDVHAPGFYFHIEPESVFLGAGIWHPDSETLSLIRDAIVEEPTKWKRGRDAKSFRDSFHLTGDSLKRPPRGYDAEHKYIDDIKRKDFIGVRELEIDSLFDASITKLVADTFKASKPFVRFLCEAIDVGF